MPTHKQIAEAYYKRETELRAGNGLDEMICREAMRLAAGDLELPEGEVVSAMRAEFTKNGGG